MIFQQIEERLSVDDLTAQLQARVGDEFAQAIPAGPLALVDFPDHSNVGDSAIWLGEMAWLDDMRRTPVYSAALNNFAAAELMQYAPEGPILIHGGGNFGTTWPRHEALRLHLLRQFPGRPIIQLPQSLYYEDEGAAREMTEAIRGHGAFTLLVRDVRSLDYAQSRFDCEVRLCPDAALYLGRLQRAPARADILALLRTDHERVADAAAPPSGTICTDWLNEGAAERNLMRARVKIDSLLSSTAQAKRLRRYRMLAAWRLRRGLATLSQGRVVVTDRLHAHILSLLLDIPQVVLDNNYGKVSGFAAQWTRRYGGFHRASSRAEAFALARQLTGES